MNFSTIAAVSTPPGKGGVALIRVSGSQAIEICEKLFRAKSGKVLSECPARYQIYGEFLCADQSEVLDDGLIAYFPAPHSFTGENVVEIACHGGEIVTGLILSALLSCGAVMAKPGEFSRRAFLNGKLSLTAAEGIADLLDAKTEEAALLSSKASRGKLSEEIKKLSDRVLQVSSSLWAYLDYPEEDLQSLSDEETVQILKEVKISCDRLVDSFRTGRAVNSGIPAVIIGKPNVGKSTFFNALLGENRAIVTEIPGTTRDVIEYPVKMGRVLLNLSDTAGVRENTADRVESIGIEKAIEALDQAELIFALFDLSRPFESDDEKILSFVKEKSGAVLIPVFTKSDLPRALDSEMLDYFADPVLISNQNESNFEELIARVEKAFISDEAALRDGRILSNARQKGAVARAGELLELAITQILSSEKDIASLTLEEALSVLLEVDGKSAGEIILNEVFSRFCIGK